MTGTSGNALGIADGGVDTTQLADDAVTADKVENALLARVPASALPAPSNANNGKVIGLTATAYAAVDAPSGGGEGGGGATRMYWGIDSRESTAPTAAVAVRGMSGTVAEWAALRLKAIYAEITGGGSQTGVGYVQSINLTTYTTTSGPTESTERNLDAGTAWLKFEFSTPVALTAGTSYVFGVRRTDGSATSPLTIIRGGAVTVTTDLVGVTRLVDYGQAIYSESNADAKQYANTSERGGFAFHVVCEFESA